MDFDPELHMQYSCSQWCPGMTADLAIANHIKVLSEKSIDNMKNLQHETKYYAGMNSTEENRFHFFHSNKISKKLIIFIHGGYWQLLDLDSSVFLANFFVEKNCNFASIGYNLCPSVSMKTILVEIRKGLKAIIDSYPEIDEIYLSGHSCGAHLALMAIIFDGFENELSLSKDDERKLKALILISGIYDIRPLCQTGENINLKLSLEDAWKFSPIRCIDRIEKFAPEFRVLVFVAEFDSPAFKEQADKFINKIINYVKSEKYLIINKDHFSLINDIGEKDYLINNIILDFLRL